MPSPLPAYVRIARLLRLAGGLAVIVAVVAVVAAFSGRPSQAASALTIAVPLAGAVLLVAIALFFRARR